MKSMTPVPQPSSFSAPVAVPSSGRRARFPFALAAVVGLSGAMASTAWADDPGKTPPAAPAATPAAMSPASAAPAGKVLLRYKAATGQTERVRGTANLSLVGSPAKLGVSQVDKIVFTKVDAATGDLTIEDTTEKSDMTTPEGTQSIDKPEVSSYTVHPNGMLVSYKSAQSGKDEAALDARLHQATAIIFSDKPVGLGDKWSQDYKADATMGTRDGHADFEIVGAPTIAGSVAYKIKMTYTESGATPITSKGVALVEAATGDELSSDDEVSGFPIAGAPATGIMHSERYEGGPLASSKNDVAAATVDAKKERTIDDVVKDGFEKLPGVVTLYRKQENGSDTIYAEVREDQIGQMMMLQATASTGTGTQVSEGDPINDMIFKFTKTPDDRLVLTVPNFKFRADEGSPMAKSLHRGFSDAFLQTFRIEAKQPDRKSMLINLSDFFKGDIAQVSSMFSSGSMGFGGMGGGGGYGMDREKTYVSAVKNFPDNLVVSTQYSFMHMGRGGDDVVLADGRNVSVLVTYNLFALPNDATTFKPTNGYRPRLADSRVGYFTGGIDGVGPNYFDFNDDNKADPAVYYIQRWDLRKKDPKAALSEPVKPIVFWIDNAVPLNYRDAVRNGLLTWNKAFEKVGFKNAIVVNQMPDSPDPKDPNTPTDTADMRFNTIRWITSPSVGFAAIALARANPLTGQVLNASISIDSDAIRLEKAFDQSVLVTPAQTFNTASGFDAEQAAMKAKLAKTPGVAGTALGVSLAAPSTDYTKLDSRYCQLGNGLKEQAWYGSLALSMIAPNGVLTPAEKKTYIDQYIQEMVSHEMGHIMGLRHNFAGSTEYSLNDLASVKTTNDGGLGASVMDYNPFNIMALHKKGVPYFSQTIGTYDYWAIQYGYTDIPSATTTEGELPVLKRIASLSAQPGHAYASDELANQFDPNVTAFDLSSDPVGYWHRTMDLSRYLLLNLDKHEPKAGESYWEFTRSFEILLNVYAGGAGEASRYIGGLNVSRSFKGDPHERPALQPIDVAKQKESLALLNDYIFAPDALTFPKRYYTELTTDPFRMDSGDFPIQDNIARLQQSTLHRLFSGSVLTRVANNEFKMGGDPTKALTMANLFTSVSGNVWAEVDAHKNVPTLRRQLQRAYVDTMVDMVTGKSGGAPEDACMLAWDQLHGLKTRLETAQRSPSAGGYDTYTRVHLAESLVKVNRALNAGIMLNSGSSGGGMNLLQLLMSGQKTDGQSGQ